MANFNFYPFESLIYHFLTAFNQLLYGDVQPTVVSIVRFYYRHGVST